MRQLLLPALLWFSVVGCGLLAGVYFAFSAFVMKALGRIDQVSGIDAMNVINAVIVRSLFMPLFLGTTLTATAFAVLAVFRWGEPGAVAMLAGSVIYVIGMFIVTMAFNVPLNNALAAATTASTDTQATDLWTRYLRDWTFWNHVRTITSAIAMVLFVVALMAR